MTLWQFSAREIQSRPGRAALTLISIVIGVAAVVAVAMSTITTRRAYKEMYQTITGLAAVEIVSETGQEFDAQIVDELAKRSDIRAVVPLLQRVTVVYHDVIHREPNAEPKKETERLKVLAMGIDPARDRDARDYKLVAGEFFEGTQGVLLESSFAKLLGLGVGDEVRVLTSSVRPDKLKVVGLLAPEGAASLRQGVMFLHLANAQRLFHLKNKIDTIHLVPNDLAQSEQLLADVEKSLPAGLMARKPAARSQLSEEMLETPQQGLELASALSLIVAAFIILNTFLMNVSERRRQLAILRAIGATKGQIRRLLLAEGLLLGLIGTAMGIGVGLAGAFYLTRVMEQLFQITLPTLHVTPLPFVLGAVIGVGISLIAVYVPAVLASRVSPLEGMRSVTKEDLEGTPAWVTWLGVTLLAIASVLVVMFVKGLLLRTVPIVAAVLALIGFVLLIPAVLGPFSRFVAVILRPLLRIEGDLAQRQLLRKRVRTTLTTGVLFVAISTGIGLGTTFYNNTEDVKQWFDRTVIGDFFIRAMNPDMASGVSANVPEELGDELRKIPGVYQVGSARIMSISVGGKGAILVARDFAAADKLPLDIREGDPLEVQKRLGEGDIVVGTVLAHRMNLKTGDEVELATRDGKKKFRIAGMANEYLVGGLALFMDRKIAKRELGIEGVDGFGIKCSREALFQVEVKLREICEKHGLLLQSWADMRRMVDTKVNGIVGGLWVLLALGFVVAGFGIANTLTMNVLEQTRELGLLRIVAMTRHQVRKMILSQAVIMGFIGLVPGAIVGAGIAYLVSRGGEGEFGRSIDFTLHPSMFFGAFVIAYLIVVIAAWIPAQRAARLQLTEALRYE
jgi:putative ABC transport system permease protein